MFTAIIYGVSAPRPFASTLASLVPAAVDGALREVVAVNLEEGHACWSIAEQAGCRMEAEREPASLIPALKGQWLVAFLSGDRPTPDWLDAVEEHSAARTASARLPVERPDWAQWRVMVGWRPTALVVPRRLALQSQAVSWDVMSKTTRGIRLRVGRGAQS